MEKVKCILIDAEKQTITEVEQSGLDDIYSLLRVTTIEHLRINSENSLYIDEEGRINGTRFGFRIINRYSSIYDMKGQMICGNALVIGITEDGRDKSPTLTINELKNLIQFFKIQ